MHRLLIILPLLLAACAPRPVAPIPIAAPLISAERLFERLDENAAAFSSLEGIAKVRIDQAGKSQSITEIVISEKPDRLRLETLSPFGTPLLLMATDGKEIDVLVPGEGKLYRGEATLGNLQRLTRLPLQLTDLVHLLLYQVPVIAHESHSVTPMDEGGVLLTLHGADGRRQELSFDSLLRLTDSAYYREEELLLKAGYGRFTNGSHPFPTSASMAMPATDTEATVAFSEVRTNVVIPEERFRLKAPEGVQILSFP